jgi:hypothetical protein
MTSVTQFRDRMPIAPRASSFVGYTRTADSSVAYGAMATPSQAGLVLALGASAIGVLIVSLAYAAGREGHSWAPVAYWGGHLLTFVPLAAYVLSSRTPSKWAAVVGIGIFQALTQWMYSPLMFKFSDELQHRQTAIDILKYHSLFHTNLALLVSPRFPGLEEITTSLMSITGLNLFAAGQIVAGVAHISVSIGIFVLLRTVTGDERVAAVAALLFEISPQNPFFNSMWAYETPALLFMAVALIGATRRGSVPGFITTGICLAAVTVTHHVTAAITGLTLLALGAGVALQTRALRRGLRLLVLGAFAVAMAAAWLVLVAPATYEYLSGPVADVISGFINAGSVSGKAPVGGSAVSLTTTAATFVGTGAMAILVMAGALIVWRRTQDALTRTFAIFALGFFGLLGVRVLATDGAELVGRLLTYEYLFACVPAALALTHPWIRKRQPIVALAIVAMLLVFIGNTTSGWPAPYELVPGKFYVDAFESGVDPPGVAAARWVTANVPRTANVACDFMACALVGSYGPQSANSDLPQIFYSQSFDQATRKLLSEHGIEYVIVDQRIYSQRPVGHMYFDSETDWQQARSPIPRQGLEKFNRDPRVQRVFDDGPLIVYDVRGLDGA